MVAGVAAVEPKLKPEVAEDAVPAAPKLKPFCVLESSVLVAPDPKENGDEDCMVVLVPLAAPPNENVEEVAAAVNVLEVVAGEKLNEELGVAVSFRDVINKLIALQMLQSMKNKISQGLPHLQDQALD